VTNMMACEKDSCRVKVCSVAGLSIMSSILYTCIFLARSLLKGGGGGGGEGGL
jgi:hypothetical protein